MRTSIMQTSQETATQETATLPRRVLGQADSSAREGDERRLHDLQGWYRYLKRQEKDWGAASWKTKVWWLRQKVRCLCTLWVEAQEMYDRYGEAVKQHHGLGRWRQIVQQVVGALRHHVPPKAYYRFQLYIEERRKEARFYVHNEQIIKLLSTLNDRFAPGEARVLHDKRHFDHHCRQHALPRIPVLAAFEDGKMTDCENKVKEYPFLPLKDLFSKPADSWRGIGAQRWTYRGGGRYESDGNAVRGKALVLALRKESRAHPLILQECLHNHPSLESLAGGALCTIRLITGRPPGGAAEVLFAKFSIPASDAATSNSSAGGLSAMIELETGSLGRACVQDPHRVAKTFAAHPDSGAQIAGRQLPNWQEAMRLGVAAHRSFERIAFVGWDIALTKDGPVLVEGNPVWGCNSLQLTHQNPLGKTRFAAYYDAWMRRCPGDVFE
jgi:hypothetical protein